MRIVEVGLGATLLEQLDQAQEGLSRMSSMFFL